MPTWHLVFKLYKKEALLFLEFIEIKEKIDLFFNKKKLIYNGSKKVYELVYYGFPENWSLEYGNEVIVDSEVMEGENSNE